MRDAIASSVSHVLLQIVHGCNYSILTAKPNLHSRLRKLIQEPLTGHTLHDQIPMIDNVARSILSSWSSKAVIQTLSEAKNFTFTVILNMVVSDLDHSSPEVRALRQDFGLLLEGLLSIPVDVPGSLYSNVLKARKRLCERLQKIVLVRRQSGQIYPKDILGALLTTEEKPFTDEQIVDNLVAILYAGHDTSGLAICFAMYFLHSHPNLMKIVEDEHNRILEEKTSNDADLTADDLRKMTLTNKVFSETLRIANIAPFVMREATEDVEYAGKLIPRNWKVLVAFKQIHLDQKFHDDPLKFDPGRFERPMVPNSFMPWGNGPRICAGMDLAKQEFLIFIHRLVTTYKWRPAGGSDLGTVYVAAQAQPAAGFPIKVSHV